MKNNTLYILAFLGLILNFQSISAQDNYLTTDPYLYKTISTTIDSDNNLNVFDFDRSVVPFFEKLSAVLAKQIKDSKKIKEARKPFILKYKGSCYEFKAYSKDCNSCVILWKDLNKDKKVQVKKELKAVCKKTGKACDIKVRKVKC